MRCGAIAIIGATISVSADAQEQSAQEASLAQKLSNPISSLVSLPFQSNYDGKIGPDNDGEKFQVNFQPVVPISFNSNWNMISRTILPIISQSDVVAGSGSQLGLGDTTQSFFFTPKAGRAGGIIWGAGPVILLPTATDKFLGGGRWGAGPTGIALKQSGSWTYGMLANHVWSIAGDDVRAGISSTFLQPFLSYTTHNAWTFGVNLESSYNWKADEWAVPANLTVSKLLKFGKQPVSIGGGIRYWISSPDNGPEGLGARLSVTFLFPS
ncbi:hypothetical protein [Novosphingobium sp. BL-8A]|uniref:hypothetical protein n=1 Tax=Novosphingobium sp. BL-8A TaxID=3127639 RepID=UPI0037564AEB